MPPDASITRRPATMATACFMAAGSMLSSSATSANPTSSTLCSCSSVSTSISILTRCPATALARSRTARTPPATAMWLSLIRIASSSPKRWLKPPPQRTAYFCRARSPGVVLRVQHTRALVWAMRRTNSEAAVAMPERWPTKLSATRSAPSKARASPVMVMSAVFAATVAPSRTCPLISTAGSSLRNAAAAIGRPAITPDFRATMTAVPRVPSGIVAIDVTSPARPRSSSSARSTASSIASGDRKASGQSRDIESPVWLEIPDSGAAHRFRDDDLRSSALEMDHPLDRAPGLAGDQRVDHDLLLHMDEAVEDLRQGDALHVRAEIARPHEVDVGQLGLDIISHRAFGHHHDPARTPLAHPVDHMRGRAGEVRFLDHVGRAFRMRDDLDRRIALAVAAQFVRGEALMHLAVALPGDDLHAGLRRDVFCEILVGQEDHLVAAQALDHLQCVRRRAADVALGLHLGRGVDVGHDRHAREAVAQHAHVLGRDRLRQRAAGAAIRDQHHFVRIEDLGGLGHEMDAALHDHARLGLGRLARELQRVADEIGDAIVDFRRLVIMRQNDGAALLLEIVDRLHVGGEKRPLDRRHDRLDALVEMRGLARDVLVPVERRHRDIGMLARRAGAAASGRQAFAARSKGGNNGHRHLLHSTNMLIMSIYGYQNIRLLPAPRSTYSHFEQIIYNTFFSPLPVPPAAAMHGTHRFDDEDSFGPRRPTPYLGWRRPAYRSACLLLRPMRASAPCQSCGSRHDHVRTSFAAHMANARGGRRLRLPDRDAELRPTLRGGPVPDPDVARLRLGARHLLLRARD